MVIILWFWERNTR